MPAVTVADITVLPRVKAVTGTRARAVRSITTAPQGFEGEGFPVRCVPQVSRPGIISGHRGEGSCRETPWGEDTGGVPFITSRVIS